MKSVGIDIGSYSIKVVEMLGTSKGVQIVQQYEHALGVSAGNDQELETLEYLRQLSSRYNPSQTRFVLGIKQEKVAIRNKVFPFSDRTKISKSLPFELEEDIPFTTDNAIFDAKIIRTLGATAEVLACAAPKQHVQILLKRAVDSDIEPYLISAEGLAFANCFEKWNEQPPIFPAVLEVDTEGLRPRRSISVVLNLGHTNTLVCAFEGPSLLAVRSVLWGGKNVAEAISRKYGLPFIEALKELQNKGFILTSKEGATFDQVTFSDLIANCVRDLVRDLQLYLLEFKSELSADISQVSLTGGTSQIQNLGAFLTQNLELPVNKTSVFTNFPVIHFDMNPRIDASFGTALGFAIEGLKKPRNPAINFMRGEFAPQNKMLIEFWEKWGHSIQIGTAALILFFIYGYLRLDFAQQLSVRADEALVTHAKNVAHLNPKNANAAGVKKYIKDNKKRAADLRRLSNLARMNSPLDIIKKISEASPTKKTILLEIKNLQLEDGNLSLEGYVKNQKEVASLQTSLSNLSINGKVSTRANSLPQAPGKVAFGFSLVVDRGIEKVSK